MTTDCPILGPAEQQLINIVSHAEKIMMQKVVSAINDAEATVAAGFHASELDSPPPPYKYFASVLHQQMYCVMCGADPETMNGGDPRIALAVIRNSQNIARHYWGADIEPSSSEPMQSTN